MRNRWPDLLKQTLLTAMLALTGCGFCRAADTSLFDQANGFYEHQQYDRAKQDYEALAKSGPWSANLFYNLGNTEWRLGNRGEAIADYERALMLEPSHPQARANLDFARDQTGAKVASPQWWQSALGALDTRAASILLAICGWAVLFSAVVAMLRAEGRTGPVVLLILSLLVAGYAAGCLWEGSVDDTKAIVIAKSAEARVAPADVAPIADVLPAGSEVLTPQVRGPWTYCTLPDGTQGWLPTEDLEKVKQS